MAGLFFKSFMDIECTSEVQQLADQICAEAIIHTGPALVCAVPGGVIQVHWLTHEFTSASAVMSAMEQVSFAADFLRKGSWRMVRDGKVVSMVEYRKHKAQLTGGG